MATNDILIRTPTTAPSVIEFADHAGDYSPTTGATGGDLAADWTTTTVQLALAGLTTTSYRQSAKADLGNPRAELYDCLAAMEFFAAPTAGQRIFFYWLPSSDATAANANTGNASGSDAAYTGYNSTPAIAITQGIMIGSMALSAAADIYIAYIGRFSPPTQWGSLVVRNESGQTLAGTDDIETNVVFIPYIPQVQS